MTFCLSVKTFISSELRNDADTLEASHCSNMAIGHSRFSVVEELSSPAFCKFAAPVSTRWSYPELPELSDSPLHSYINCAFVGYNRK
jgi:hypothetical protein